MEMTFQRLGGVLARQRRFRLARDGMLTPLAPGAAWARDYVVLSRAMVSHAFLTAPPGANRDDLEAAAASLVSSFGVYDEPGQAMEPIDQNRWRVWYWDARHVRRRLEESGMVVDRLEVVPEPLVAASDDTVELVEHSDCFEGRAWKDTGLATTLWWSTRPSEAQWLQFLRSARRRPEVRPRVRAGSFAPGPRRGRDLFTDIFLKPSAVGWTLAAVLLIGGPVAYQAGHIARLGFEQYRLTAELRVLEEPLGDYRELRASSLQAVSEIGRLERFSQASAPGPALAAVHEAVAEEGWEIRKWSHRPGQIVVEAAGPAPNDLAAVVARMDRSDLLTGVSVRPDARGGYQIEADLGEAAVE